MMTEPQKVTLVQGKCDYCKKIIIAPKEKFEETWNRHLDGCEKYQSFISKITELDEKGLLKPYLKILRIEQLEKELKKILKKYKSSEEELITILNQLQSSKGSTQ